MFSNLKIGDDIDKDDLNDSLKEIYLTDYFKDVKISFSEGIVNINVQENPIVKSVTINGIKKKNINEKISEITSKIEKYPFVENKINNQVKLLKNILKSFGYYFVELKTSINSNDDNTVNLVFDFNLGEIAKIKKINFIGDKVFRDSTLRNIIISEETKFWKFITRNKFLDANRINADIFRLNNFYKNRGYFNVKVKSSTAVITDKNQFELIFNIDAGNKYFINKFIFENNDNISKNNIELFKNQSDNLIGKKYSKKKS